jgi:hypothetical protein
VNPGDRLQVVLTGELVMLVGQKTLEVQLEPGMVLRQVLARLGGTVHPWFRELVEAGGLAAGLGTVMILLNGDQVQVPGGFDLPVRPGVMYLIPPIPGG